MYQYFNIFSKILKKSCNFWLNAQIHWFFLENSQDTNFFKFKVPINNFPSLGVKILKIKKISKKFKFLKFYFKVTQITRKPKNRTFRDLKKKLNHFWKLFKDKLFRDRPQKPLNFKIKFISEIICGRSLQ
jgi:hypothetical protein